MGKKSDSTSSDIVVAQIDLG